MSQNQENQTNSCNCPSCGANVPIPSGIRDVTKLRCQYCGDEFVYNPHADANNVSYVTNNYYNVPTGDSGSRVGGTNPYMARKSAGSYYNSRQGKQNQSNSGGGRTAVIVVVTVIIFFIFFSMVFNMVSRMDTGRTYTGGYSTDYEWASSVQEGDLSVIDPFENLVVTYSGTEPNLRVNLSGEASFVDYKVSRQSGLSNGDEIVITAAVRSYYTDEYKVSSSQKTYKVQGAYYAVAYEDIESTLPTIKKYLYPVDWKDKILSWGNWSDTVTPEDSLELYKVFLRRKKDKTTNDLIFIYAYKLNGNTYYCCQKFEELIVQADGGLKVDYNYSMRTVGNRSVGVAQHNAIMVYSYDSELSLIANVVDNYETEYDITEIDKSVF